MKTFNDLKTRVYEIAQQRFGYITDNIKQRLDTELNAIKKYKRTELIICLWRLFNNLSKKGICAKFQTGNGYGVSLICHLLGFTLFNPMEHPNLISERYVLNTLKQTLGVSFKIDVNDYNAIEEILYNYGYEFEKTAIGDNVRLMHIKFSEKGSRNFVLHYRYKHNVCMLQRAFRVIGNDKFYNIPYNNEEVFESIYNLDLYGITSYCFAPITIEALKLIKPNSLSLLTEALAFTSELQSEDLKEYLSNKANGWTKQTGHPEVDEMLSHTYGVVLFSRQEVECKKWLNLTHWDNDKWPIYKERVERLLSSGHEAANKCDKYLMAHNLYKLAYIRHHYPKQFKEIFNNKQV